MTDVAQIVGDAVSVPCLINGKLSASPTESLDRP